MMHSIKFRVEWLSILAVLYAGLTMGQSLDAGLPSSQIDSRSSSAQSQGSGAESVNASIHPLAQGDLPNVQVSSDVEASPGVNLQSEQYPSTKSSNAARLPSSITGWSTAQRKAYRDRYPDINPMNHRRSSHETTAESRVAGTALRREAPPRFSGRMQTRIETRIPTADVPTSDAVGAIYQGDFPDSTRMATFASPPDPGTESPLAWSPVLSFGLRDMQTTQFLNPNLRAQLRRRHLRGSLRRNGLLSEAPGGPPSADQSLNIDPERQLEDTLSPTPPPSPLSTLDQQINPDVDQ